MQSIKIGNLNARSFTVFTHQIHRFRRGNGLIMLRIGYFTFYSQQINNNS